MASGAWPIAIETEFGGLDEPTKRCRRTRSKSYSDFGESGPWLAEADSTRDAQGGLILNSTIYKGLNSTLQVASNRSLTFPRMLSADETQVANSTTYGQELFQSKASYVFQTKLTQASNDANESVADIVNQLAQSLESQGYQRSN